MKKEMHEGKHFFQNLIWKYKLARIYQNASTCMFISTDESVVLLETRMHKFVFVMSIIQIRSGINEKSTEDDSLRGWYKQKCKVSQLLFKSKEPSTLRHQWQNIFIRYANFCEARCCMDQWCVKIWFDKSWTMHVQSDGKFEFLRIKLICHKGIFL